MPPFGEIKNLGLGYKEEVIQAIKNIGNLKTFHFLGNYKNFLIKQINMEMLSAFQ